MDKEEIRDLMKKTIIRNVLFLIKMLDASNIDYDTGMKAICDGINDALGQIMAGKRTQDIINEVLPQ